MAKTVKVVVAEDFPKPDSCFDCPLVQWETILKPYCKMLGEKDGLLPKNYDAKYKNPKCKFKELTFTVAEEDENYGEE